MLHSARPPLASTRRRAFTLVEVIAATALAAMLMAAVLQLTVTLNRSARVDEATRRPQSPARLALDIIREDLTHAAGWRRHNEVIELYGPLRRNTQGAHDGYPAVVSYHVVPAGESPWSVLVRRQTTLASETRVASVGLLAVGVTRLAMGHVLIPEQDASGAASEASSPATRTGLTARSAPAGLTAPIEPVGPAGIFETEASELDTDRKVEETWHPLPEVVAVDLTHVPPHTRDQAAADQAGRTSPESTRPQQGSELKTLSQVVLR